MRVGALEAAGRGLANLLANRQLVLVQLGVGLVALALVVAAVAPLLAPLGVELTPAAIFDPRSEPPQPEAWVEAGRALVRQLTSGTMWNVLFALLGAALVASTLAIWAQAGTIAIFVAGDRQAPPGPSRPTAVFRAFDLRLFRALASRYLGKFLSFYGFLFLLVGVVAGGVILAAAGAATAAGRWGGIAAVGVGCGAALPIGFALVVLIFVGGLGPALVARDGITASGAARLALAIVGRRLGALVALHLLFFVASAALGAFTTGIAIAGGSAFSDVSWAPLAFGLGTGLLEWVGGVVVQLWMAASLVAIATGETR